MYVFIYFTCANACVCTWSPTRDNIGLLRLPCTLQPSMRFDCQEPRSGARAQRYQALRLLLRNRSHHLIIVGDSFDVFFAYLVVWNPMRNCKTFASDAFPRRERGPTASDSVGCCGGGCRWHSAGCLELQSEVPWQTETEKTRQNRGRSRLDEN